MSLIQLEVLTDVNFFSSEHLVGFISVGNVFGKAFRTQGLDERKGRWVNGGTRF